MVALIPMYVRKCFKRKIKTILPNGRFQTSVRGQKIFFLKDMFSDVVLPPEAEYAKKNNQQEARFGAREQKSLQNRGMICSGSLKPLNIFCANWHIQPSSVGSRAWTCKISTFNSYPLPSFGPKMVKNS